MPKPKTVTVKRVFTNDRAADDWIGWITRNNTVLSASLSEVDGGVQVTVTYQPAAEPPAP